MEKGRWSKARAVKTQDQVDGHSPTQKPNADDAIARPPMKLEMYTNRQFLIGLFTMWVFWFGLGVVYVELITTGLSLKAIQLLRLIPFWGE